MIESDSIASAQECRYIPFNPDSSFSLDSATSNLRHTCIELYMFSAVSYTCIVCVSFFLFPFLFPHYSLAR